MGNMLSMGMRCSWRQERIILRQLIVSSENTPNSTPIHCIESGRARLNAYCDSVESQAWIERLNKCEFMGTKCKICVLDDLMKMIDCGRGNPGA